MAPSSLIFVVIVGVWGAFFVQYWIRRREHIATARSVDAFTETMRVLQVRDPHPQVDLDGPPRRSYVVSPTRAVRPQVTVKRAEALLTPADHAWQAPADDAEPVHQWPVGSPRDRFRVEVTRATRGLTFVVALLATVVYAVLAATGVLRPWAVLVPLAVAVGGFLWVRAGVVAEQAARRSHSRSSARPDAHRRAVSGPRVAPARGGSGAARPSVDAAAAGEGHALTDASVETTDRRDLIFDVDESAPAASADSTVAAPVVPAARVAQVAAPLLDEDDMPLTWDPVPVPRPTYTMKAQAHRVAPPSPAAAPARSRGQQPQPIVADYDDDVPEEFPVRKVVGG